MGSLARGASGKAILAFMASEAVEGVLKTLPKESDRKLLLDDLAKVRRDKFRISRGEVFAGAVSIAAPYFDHMHRVAGSIAVQAPEARATDAWMARMTKRVVAASADVSVALGYRPSGLG